MMFHFAPPEVNGLGVITSTPSFVRSSQVLMFLGLPLRVASTTTELVTKPSYSSLFQSARDLLGLDELVDVGRERQRDDVRLEAGLDGPGLVTGRAVGLLEADVLAVGGVLEGGNDLLVRLLRRRVGDEADAAPAPRGVAGATARREAECHEQHERQCRDRDSLADAHEKCSPFCLSFLVGKDYGGHLNRNPINPIDNDLFTPGMVGSPFSTNSMEKEGMMRSPPHSPPPRPCAASGTCATSRGM